MRKELFRKGALQTVPQRRALDYVLNFFIVDDARRVLALSRA